MRKHFEKPIIGISGKSEDSQSVLAMMDLISTVGGIPEILIDHGKRNALEDLQGCDGIIIMGNDDDIDPAEYGDEKHPATKLPLASHRADYEKALILGAIAKKMPLLGICGGMQRIITLHGGGLHQHLPEIIGESFYCEAEAHYMPVQFIAIEQTTRLGEIAGNIKSLVMPDYTNSEFALIMQHSFHHQAVDMDRIPSDFIASAFSDGGQAGKPIVEAIEVSPHGKFKHQFILGVQFHPEFSDSEIGSKLAAVCVREAKKYKHTSDWQNWPSTVASSSFFPLRLADMHPSL